MSSSDLYADVFRYLADDAHDDRALEFAEVVLEYLEHEPFYAADLGVDDSLIDLGLARLVRGHDGDTFLAYRGTWEYDEFEPIDEEE